jgi:hypothetical protein
MAVRGRPRSFAGTRSPSLHGGRDGRRKYMLANIRHVPRGAF